MLLSIFVYTCLFVYILNWAQIHFFVRALTKPKVNITHIRDSFITNTLINKIGINIKDITIFEDKRLFGMMPSTPLHPKLILSRGLYETLNKDELEWVILHEGAHCKMWHVVKCTIVQVIFLLLGSFFIYISFVPWYVSPLISVFFGLLCIRIMQLFEWEADHFSISHVDNTEGVISAQAKFTNAWYREKGMSWFHNETYIFRKLLFWNILPSERIAMAKKTRSHIKTKSSGQD